MNVRYALMRADGRWFQHPHDLNPTEWTPRIQEAHLWAYLCGQLRCEDVLPIEIVVSQSGQRFQATYSNVSA